MKIRVKTRVPGPKSRKLLAKLKRLNVGWSTPYPFVQNGKGSGCYLEDVDGNVFLDFGSQICTAPLGYNHPDMVRVVKEVKNAPVKIAGQDFTCPEHIELIEKLVSVCPPGLDSAMVLNSGAEAVENCIKLALRKRSSAKYGVSFESAFHGRTLGALSMTNSKSVHKRGFMGIPTKRLPYGEEAGEKLRRLIEQEGGAEGIGFVIVEAVQGEGGYNVGPGKMLKDVRAITRAQGIPLICDEVQAGMGRTGEWWAYQHSGIVPDLMSSAKALQVGAAVANRKKFAVEPGSISSTWGGGHTLDLALGVQVIETITKQKLLSNVKKMGGMLKKGLEGLASEHNCMDNVRGIGLMLAFDMRNGKERNSVILEMVKEGVVVLGTGTKGIRVIPPYVVGKGEAEEFIRVLEEVVHRHDRSRVKHSGEIHDYVECGSTHA